MTLEKVLEIFTKMGCKLECKGEEWKTPDWSGFVYANIDGGEYYFLAAQPENIRVLNGTVQSIPLNEIRKLSIRVVKQTLL